MFEKEEIQNFQILFKSEFGIDISYEDAEEYAFQFVGFLLAIYKD